MSRSVTKYSNLDNGFVLKSVLLAFVILIALILSQITYGINQLELLQKNIEARTAQQFEKLRLLSNAETVGVRRNSLLIKWSLSHNEAENIQLYNEFQQYDDHAMNAIRQLQQLESDPQARKLLVKQAQNLSQIKLAQLSAINLLQQGSMEAAQFLLLSNVMQQQNMVRDTFLNLRDNQQAQVQILLKKVRTEYNSTRTTIIWTGVFVVIAVILISMTVIYRLMNHVGNIENKLTSLEASRSRLHKKATRDTLTGLFNRSQLTRYLHQKTKENNLSKKFAVLYLDLDGFKNVNDEFGHVVGDRLLSLAAQRMQGMLRAYDFIARVGGDEFVIVMEDDQGIGVAKTVAQQLIAFLQEPYSIGSVVCKTGVSIGISYYPEHGKEAGELLHNADQAMYAAKNNGKNQFVQYSSSRN